MTLLRIDLHPLLLALVATGTACADDISEAASASDTETSSDTGTDSTTVSTTDMTATSATTMSSASATGDTSATADTSGTDSSASDPSSESSSADSSTDPSDGSSSTGIVGECGSADDCETLYGAAPCGAWECNANTCDVICANCADDDADGYGIGNGCAGPDCDDADDQIGANAVTACYSGPNGTLDVGTCTSGTVTCIDGVSSPCVGEIVPSGEACNGLDDDCNGADDDNLGTFDCGLGACAAQVSACVGGQVQACVPGQAIGPDNTCDAIDDDCDGAIDENCIANCVWVTPTGNANGDGSLALPFLTIQQGIDAAQPGEQVCVAAGAACNATNNYAGAVLMRDGVSVYGSYETTGQTRCNNRNTRIVPGNATGVSFDATVQSTTVLDGFRVDRANLATAAGITIDGSTGVVISDIEMQANGGGAVVDSWGVDMLNGAVATITRSILYGGNGSGASAAVRSVGATPTIISNCDSLAASGRCDDGCGQPGSTVRALRGRNSGGGTSSYAVLLQDSPDASVESSSLCANATVDGSSVRVIGDATGVVVRGNYVSAWGGSANSHGFWLEDCGGAAPWIVDNERVLGEGGNALALVDGIRAVGDCHPVIDSNVLIAGGSEGGSASPNGVYCGANANGASQCVVLGNTLIRGAQFGVPPLVAGVRCDDDACMRIEDNVIIAGGGVNITGVWLEQSGTVVDGNTISGGCATVSATGLHADDSFARVQNNFITSGSCNGAAAQFNTGLRLLVGDGGNEMDVHSNTIAAVGNVAGCTGYGVEMRTALGAVPVAGVGVFRNNVINGGDCSAATYVFAESDATADPRVFENNDLDPYSAPTALYLDEAAMAQMTAASVDALADMTVSGTLDEDPTFITWPTDLHIAGGSVCDGAGTPVGAPAEDFDGEMRDAVTPDVGADEI